MSSIDNFTLSVLNSNLTASMWPPLQLLINTSLISQIVGNATTVNHTSLISLIDLIPTSASCILLLNFALSSALYRMSCGGANYTGIVYLGLQGTTPSTGGNGGYGSSWYFQQYLQSSWTNAGPISTVSTLYRSNAHNAFIYNVSSNWVYAANWYYAPNCNICPPGQYQYFGTNPVGGLSKAYCAGGNTGVICPLGKFMLNVSTSHAPYIAGSCVSVCPGGMIPHTDKKSCVPFIPPANETIPRILQLKFSDTWTSVQANPNYGKNLIAKMAAATGVAESRFTINSIAPGSILVVFTISPSSNASTFTYFMLHSAWCRTDMCLLRFVHCRRRPYILCYPSCDCECNCDAADYPGQRLVDFTSHCGSYVYASILERMC